MAGIAAVALALLGWLYLYWSLATEPTEPTEPAGPPREPPRYRPPDRLWT